ncbi:hypothetical protein E1A91_D12G155400v1 [Gossypium mustelinum]|uniref:Uncharacterized protein n=3 Tax=Gossypium TaxID=3633 RepID=A0A0D2SN94_GOSRA|nr:hypothetical protein ES319_D12G153600v1 [Gossypium barbadense]KJB43441.1 hypothetical protein B456_007G200400 [Gossypium raimondii]TYI51145.1 hypothetical protein E1A91_D12G155400v1 [Gossypium mustelinum]
MSMELIFLSCFRTNCKEQPIRNPYRHDSSPRLHICHLNVCLGNFQAVFPIPISSSISHLMSSSSLLETDELI